MDAHADKPRATSMTLIRRIILAFALMARLDPAIALAPPPVPSLLDAPRIAEDAVAQLRDLGRHCRGEAQRLPRVGERRDDAPD